MYIKIVTNTMDNAFGQVVQWITQARAAGLSDTQIADQLKAQGWSPEQVSQVLKPLTPTPAPLPTHALPSDIAAAMSGKSVPHGTGPTQQGVPSAAQPAATPGVPLPGPITLYRATFANYASRFGYYLGYGAIAGALSIGITLGLGWLLISTVFSNFLSISSAPSSTSIVVYIAILVAVYFGMILLNTLTATWLWSAIGLTVMAPDGQRQFFAIFTSAVKRIRHIFWANLIVGYILAGFMVLAVLIAAAGGLGMSYFNLYDLPDYLFPILGTILFVTTLSWIGTYLVYTPFVALTGNGRGVHAVRESQTIVHGLWWRTFGRLAAIVAPIIGFTVLAQIIIVLLNLDSIIPTIALTLIDVMFFLPIFITYTLGMYNTAANYRQQAKPAGRVSTVSMIVAATLGWLLVVGSLIWAFISFRSYAQPYDDVYFDDSQAPLNSNTPSFGTNTNAGSAEADADLQRSMDLFGLQWALASYRMEKNAFPAKLSDLAPGYVEKIPVDPQTNLPYAYAVTSNGKDFSLCATLATGKNECVHDPNAGTESNSNAAPDANSNVGQ